MGLRRALIICACCGNYKLAKVFSVVHERGGFLLGVLTLVIGDEPRTVAYLSK